MAGGTSDEDRSIHDRGGLPYPYAPQSRSGHRPRKRQSRGDSLGLKEVAITDHGPANLFGVGVASLSALTSIRQEVIAARERYPDMKVLLGAEANVVSEDGEIDIPPELQDAMDIVLVGLHPLVKWKRPAMGISLVGLDLISAWTGKGRVQARQRNTAAIVNAVLRNRVHVVTHPGYRLPIDTRALSQQACAKTGCAMEINEGRNVRRRPSISRSPEATKGRGFSLGVITHSPGRVGDLAKADFSG